MFGALFTTLVSFALPVAEARFEVRASFANYDQAPKKFNAQMQGLVRNAPELKGSVGLGVDGIYRPPVLPLMIGLRHETLGSDQSGQAMISGTAVDTSTKLAGSRSSLLVGWDVLGLPVGHLSLVGHYAFQQNLKYTMSSKNAAGSTHVDSFTGVLQPGFGGGIEAGFRIGFVAIATELGYTVFKTREFTSDGATAYDSAGQKIQADLSGSYWRVMAGLSFQ